MFCFCKLCERDKSGTVSQFNASLVTYDRLAVLEKDHKAMERLRHFPKESLDVLNLLTMWETTIIDGKKYFGCFEKDPADVILEVGK